MAQAKGERNKKAIAWHSFICGWTAGGGFLPIRPHGHAFCPSQLLLWQRDPSSPSSILKEKSVSTLSLEEDTRMRESEVIHFTICKKYNLMLCLYLLTLFVSNQWTVLQSSELFADAFLMKFWYFFSIRFLAREETLETYFLLNIH